MKKFILLIVFTWLVSFYRDYETGEWWWECWNNGWFRANERYATKVIFLTKEDALEDFKNFVLSTKDREWKEE